MKIEKVETRNTEQHNAAWLKAEKERRIFFEISSRRGKVRISYDTWASDVYLTEAGIEKIKETVFAYMRSLAGKVKRRSVLLGFGPVAGFFSVEKLDADRVADQVLAILSNEEYHQGTLLSHGG